MTGLLHRLAARATGTAWTVRSDARLPFGAGDLAEAETPQDLVAPLVGDPPLPAAPPVRAASRFASPAPPESTAPAAPHEPATAWPTGSTRPQAPATVPAFADPSPTDQNRSTVAWHDADVPAQRAAAARKAAPPPLAAQPDGRAVRDAAPQPWPRPQARDDPAPLLPPARTAAAQAGKAAPEPDAAASRWRGASPPAARQDTEVHIHIGRIDVTVPQDAPAPKARTRERTQPVSLDAYLAKRGQAR